MKEGDIVRSTNGKHWRVTNAQPPTNQFVCAESVEDIRVVRVLLKEELVITDPHPGGPK